MGTRTVVRPASTDGVRSGGMFAGDVAKALGIGVQTLHYYEREGLIPAPPRSEAGYRLYSPELVERVTFVRKAQALGLPLHEIRDVLVLAEQGTSPCGRVQRALADKLAEVDRRLANLQRFRRELAAFVAGAGEISARRGAQVCAIVEDAPPLPVSDVSHTPLAPVGRRQRPSASRGRRAP